MWKRNKNINEIKAVVLGLITIIIAVIGCGDSIKRHKLASVFEANVKEATQSLSMNASSGGTITGDKGVIFTCGPDAFLDKNGNPVSGNVDIELVEALNYREMLILNKQTMGDDNGTLRPLVSGGQMYLNAKQGEAQLKLAQGSCTVKFPTNSFDANMVLFKGDVDADGTAIWQPTAIKPTFVESSSGGGSGNSGPTPSYYQFPNDNLNWWNCDYFWNAPDPKTKITVIVPAGYDAWNTHVWIVIPSVNSVTVVPYNDLLTGIFKTHIDIPVGLEINIVALADDGSYFSSFKTVTVTDGMVHTITFQPTTLEQFELDAQGL